MRRTYCYNKIELIKQIEFMYSSYFFNVFSMIYRKPNLLIIILFFITSCEQINSTVSKDANINGKLITDTLLQDRLFNKLIQLTNTSTFLIHRDDSLAFLLLPVEASCPTCRGKAIDSIDKYKDRLGDNHFIIISGKGRKSIGGYFKERGKLLPINNQKIFLDTLDQAFSNDLTTDNPKIYYSYSGKVYRIVSCLPSTIKKDLSEYFKSI